MPSCCSRNMLQGLLQLHRLKHLLGSLHPLRVTASLPSRRQICPLNILCKFVWHPRLPPAKKPCPGKPMQAEPFNMQECVSSVLLLAARQAGRDASGGARGTVLTPACTGCVAGLSQVQQSADADKMARGTSADKLCIAQSLSYA